MTTMDVNRGLTLPGGKNLGKAILPQKTEDLWRQPNSFPFLGEAKGGLMEAVYTNIPFAKNEYLQQVIAATGIYGEFYDALNSLFGPLLIKYSIGGYIFDGVIRADHAKRTRITSHPVQTGAAITDHSFNEPDEIVLEVAMSDAMRDKKRGQFGEGAGRSKKAFEALTKLKEARQPLEVVTRLKTYKNMLIESMEVADDFKTTSGLRATVVLREVFFAAVDETTVSARPHTTGATVGGELSPEPATDSQKSIIVEMGAAGTKGSNQGGG
jgi:hypothetical protein